MRLQIGEGGFGCDRLRFGAGSGEAMDGRGCTAAAALRVGDEAAHRHFPAAAIDRGFDLVGAPDAGHAVLVRGEDIQEVLEMNLPPATLDAARIDEERIVRWCGDREQMARWRLGDRGERNRIDEQERSQEGSGK